VSPSELVAALERARRRTDQLVSQLSDEQLTHQVSPLQSPLVWDLGHIGYFEELWLLRRVGGRPALSSAVDAVYDSFAHTRNKRATLPLLSPSATRDYLGEVRAGVHELLPELPLDDGDPLLADGFVVGLVVQHELQHGETMAQTLALAGWLPPLPSPPTVTAIDDVAVPAGPFTLGSTDAWAYDNERPAHVVDVPAFRIDRGLVTNADFAAFVATGAYRDRAAWTDEGWDWREAEQADAPLRWDPGAPPDAPVQHVSFHEADAYARSAGKRLPTEPEWEKAARTAAAELEHMSGAVWQWTSSCFDGYPGFSAFPYAEYSEPFFGDGYRVLRGGSPFADPLVARPTFRNWDLPERRQIFCGVRCARDA
jgi:gamma-glutamyl hercynylcysteine S-oxide synthase